MFYIVQIEHTTKTRGWIIKNNNKNNNKKKGELKFFEMVIPSELVLKQECIIRPAVSNRNWSDEALKIF